MGWQVVPQLSRSSGAQWSGTKLQLCQFSLTGTSGPLTELCPSALCKKDSAPPGQTRLCCTRAPHPCSCPSQPVMVVTAGLRVSVSWHRPPSRMMVWSTAPDTHCLPHSRQQRNVSSVSQWPSRPQTPHKEILPIKDHWKCKNPINLIPLREKRKSRMSSPSVSFHHYQYD